MKTEVEKEIVSMSEESLNRLKVLEMNLITAHLKSYFGGRNEWLYYPSSNSSIYKTIDKLVIGEGDEQFEVIAVNNELLLKRKSKWIEVQEFLNHDNLFKQFDAGTGTQYLFRFDNGFGASVVNNISSYTNGSDEWELAVVYFDEEDAFEIYYGSHITDDVLGHQSVQEVLNVLDEIKTIKEDL